MAPPTALARQNLPVESDSLIGRDRDLSDLLRLVESDRVLTLAGVDGIGKTRLALRLAAQATASFADGVWLVSLADVSTRAEVVVRICGALGVTEEVQRDPLATLSDALRGRALLLVLDGFDEVSGHVAEIGAALVAACPSVSLLATGREPLCIGDETVWRVPPLPVPPRAGHGAAHPDSGAVRLFLDRARAAAPGYADSPAELAAVSRVCRRLDGIPLAIELAAAWAGRIDPAGIDAGLAQAFDESGVPAATGITRSRVLGAVVDWSHSLLSEPERILLRRLSVFPNWCLELAEQVCADPPLAEADILDLLSALLDRSLLTLTGEHQNRVRYRIPEPVRDHARARLAESGELRRVRRRHTARMVAIAEDLGSVALSSRPMPWAERFAYWDRATSEYDNLRAALHWSAASGRTRDGLRICAGLRPSWMTGYHFAEGSDWAETFLQMAEKEADRADPRGDEHPGGGHAADGGESLDALRGRVMLHQAELAWPQRPLDETAERVRTGAALSRVAGDTESAGLAENLLALLDVVRGDTDAGRERATGVLEASRAAGDLWNEAIALNLQGALAASGGAFAEADMRFNTALMIMRGMDHRWGVGSTLMAQAAAAEARGDAQAADRCYREAMDIQRTIGAAPELAACLAGVGRVAVQLGSIAQAFDYLGESLQLSHANGQCSGVVEALASIAAVAEGQGPRADAARCAGAAAALAEAGGRGGRGPARFLLSGEADPPAASQQTRAWWEEGRRLGIEDAVALAAAIAESGRQPHPRTSPARRSKPQQRALTPREREIAQLIGEGQSNRAISERLFIAPATVARHVANINRKTGFTSRRQIAAWIGQHAAPVGTPHSRRHH